MLPLCPGVKAGWSAARGHLIARTKTCTSTTPLFHETIEMVAAPEHSHNAQIGTNTNYINLPNNAMQRDTFRRI